MIEFGSAAGQQRARAGEEVLEPQRIVADVEAVVRVGLADPQHLAADLVPDLVDASLGELDILVALAALSIGLPVQRARGALVVAEPVDQLVTGHEAAAPDKTHLAPGAGRVGPEVFPMHVVADRLFPDDLVVLGLIVSDFAVRRRRGLRVGRADLRHVAHPGLAAADQQVFVAQRGHDVGEVGRIQAEVQRALDDLGGRAPDRVGVAPASRHDRRRRARVDGRRQRLDVGPEQREAAPAHVVRLGPVVDIATDDPPPALDPGALLLFGKLEFADPARNDGRGTVAEVRGGVDLLSGLVHPAQYESAQPALRDRLRPGSGGLAHQA